MIVSHTKFDINRMINDGVRAKYFHSSKISGQKWGKCGPEGPENFSEHESCPEGFTYKISEESIHKYKSYEK